MLAFNPIAAGAVHPDQMIPAKPALKLENMALYLQTPAVRPILPPQFNDQPCPIPAGHVDFNQPPIPPPTNFSKAFKTQAIAGFAGEAIQQVLALSHPPLVPVPVPNVDIIQAQKKLDDVVAELRRLGAPIAAIGAFPPSASVSSGPLPPGASSGLEAELHLLTQQLHALLANGASFTPFAHPFTPAPGSSMSSILAPTIYATPASPSSTVIAPGTALPPQYNIYDVLGMNPHKFEIEQSRDGGYKRVELEAIINRAAATGLTIVPSMNIDSMGVLRWRLRTFIHNFQHDPRFAPLAPSTVVRIQTGQPSTPIPFTPISFPGFGTPSAPSSPASAAPRRLTQPPTAGPSGSGLPAPSGKAGQWIPINRNHFIHWPKLEGQGVFSLTRKAGKGEHVKVNKFPNRRVSKSLKEALITLLKSQKLGDLSEMPTEEREFLYSLLALTEPSQVLADVSARQREKVSETKAAIKKVSAEQALSSRLRSQQQRLQLLIGESQAGNTHNAVLIKESKKILNLFVRHGVITKDQADELQSKIL